MNEEEIRHLVSRDKFLRDEIAKLKAEKELCVEALRIVLPEELEASAEFYQICGKVVGNDVTAITNKLRYAAARFRQVLSEVDKGNQETQNADQETRLG